MKPVVRILFVIDTLGSGGKERRLTELLKALSTRQDTEFQLVVMSNDIHYTDVYKLGIVIHRIIRRSPKDPLVFSKLRTLIKSYNPDAVHCWESMTAVYLAPVCFLLNCRLINGMVTNAPVRQNITNHHWLRGRLTFPFSWKVVSNSVAGLKAYRVPAGKGVVIANGFNFGRLDNLIGRDAVRDELHIGKGYIIGMVASFTIQKDYPTFYKAAQLLLEKRNDVTFLAIGKGTDSEESTEYVQGSFRDHFRFLGIREDVESLVNTMDIGVLSTFTEGLSNSVIEYMALGKPVIASEGGGTPELVQEGRTGFLVPVAEPDALAEKMDMLLNDADMRDRMGEAGKEIIRTRFSIDIMVNKYVNLYKQASA
jgi:glycosyltransferase involved in cell wall biosynthesis